ncbi:MAG: PAC2 family protein, partial [Peptidiphaga gingivicola]
MGHFVSFPEAEGPERVERLVLNLVDPAVDAGAVGQLISLSLSPLDGGAAALFNSDPLIDYRSQRPLMNYKDGRLVDMRRSGIVLSHASDVEGQPFLHLHGAEPDFQWDALLADMIDIIERFGVKSTFSFTAVPSATPHTRPADMVVRTADKREDQVFEADFWFTASFADYVEFHTAKLGISHTNVAVRVPVYLAGDRYFTGAAGALGLTSSLSGLYFPLGDLEQAAAEEVEAYSSAIEGNEELAQFIDKLEKDYDANGSVRGYVTAPKPELRVPTVDEIGRAAEQFLAGVSSPRASASEKTFDPQGLLRKMERYQGFLPGEPGVGESPAFDVSAMRSHQA